MFNLVEEGRTIILVTAQHKKAVPGRKTDVKDAEWIAERYAAWLAASASFIPSKPSRDLRELVRYGKTLVQERARSGSIGCKRCWERPTSRYPRWEVL